MVFSTNCDCQTPNYAYAPFRGASLLAQFFRLDFAWRTGFRLELEKRKTRIRRMQVSPITVGSRNWDNVS